MLWTQVIFNLFHKESPKKIEFEAQCSDKSTAQRARKASLCYLCCSVLEWETTLLNSYYIIYHIWD